MQERTKTFFEASHTTLVSPHFFPTEADLDNGEASSRETSGAHERIMYVQQVRLPIFMPFDGAVKEHRVCVAQHVYLRVCFTYQK